MSILAELYREWHSPREKPWAGEHEDWDRSEDLWMQAEKYLDADLFDELKRSVMDLMDTEACHEFEEGFRLGVQLMLEMQRPAAHCPSSTASAPVR